MLSYKKTQYTNSMHIKNHKFKPGKKVAIIGGGFLGLSLAYYLGKANIETVLIEKQQDLGGLANTIKVNNGNLEKYYHHLFKSDSSIYSLLKELGIADKLEWIPAKMGIFINDKLHNFSGPLDLLKFEPLPFFARIRAGIVSFYLQKFANPKHYKEVTALAWCQKNYGSTVTRILWEPLLKSKFNDSYDKVAMIWLWARLHDRGSSRPNLFADEQLGYIKGSFKTAIDTLEQALKDTHVKVYKNSGILDFQDGGRIHKLVWRDHKGKMTQAHFTHIVATIPPEQFLDIFNAPKPYSKQWQSIEFIGALCINLVLKKSLSRYYWTSINNPAEPFVALIEHTNLVDKANFNNKHIVYLAKYCKTTDAIFQADEQKLRTYIIDFLHKINPDFSPDWIESMSYFKASQAQHIVKTDYQIPEYKSGIKNVYLAHFAQIYPHDRGTNYAVAQAQELFKLIKQSN